jgi:hypothetical protein
VGVGVGVGARRQTMNGAKATGRVGVAVGEAVAVGVGVSVGVSVLSNLFDCVMMIQPLRGNLASTLIGQCGGRFLLPQESDDYRRCQCTFPSFHSLFYF